MKMKNEMKRQEFKAYAYSGAIEGKCWETVKSVSVLGYSKGEAAKAIRRAYPNADKYSVATVRTIIGDWNH